MEQLVESDLKPRNSNEVGTGAVATATVVRTATARARTKAVSSVTGADGNSTVTGKEQRAGHEWLELQVEAPREMPRKETTTSSLFSP
ncbi:hypothetical protein NL676_030209 [Syzygium grande]|nr:hypothetical protein NL676_030209 [Syzygium grande]